MHNRNLLEQHKVFTETRKFSIQGPWAEGGNSSINFSFDAGRIILEQWQKHPEDTAKGPIKLSMDIDHWLDVLAVLRHATSLPVGGTIKLSNLTGKPSAKVTDSVLAVGRGNDGIIRISLQKTGRPAVSIPVITSPYAEIAHVDESIKQSLNDEIYLTKINELFTICRDGAILDAATVEERKTRGAAKAAKYGKGNGGQGGGQNYSNGNSVSADDIMM